MLGEQSLLHKMRTTQEGARMQKMLAAVNVSDIITRVARQVCGEMRRVGPNVKVDARK